MTPLLATGGRDGEEALNEAQTRRAVGAKGTFAPQDRRAEGAFGGVVGRFNALRSEEIPQGRFERFEIGCVVFAERRVEVDDVQQLRAFVVPTLGDDDGIFGVDGFGGGLTLCEPDAAPAAQINGWDDDHASTTGKWELTVGADSRNMVRLSLTA